MPAKQIANLYRMVFFLEDGKGIPRGEFLLRRPIFKRCNSFILKQIFKKIEFGKEKYNIPKNLVDLSLPFLHQSIVGKRMVNPSAQSSSADANSVGQ